MYGFVLAERLNLVMHEEILSVYTFPHEKIKQSNKQLAFVSPVFAGKKNR